MTMPFNAAFLS